MERLSGVGEQQVLGQGDFQYAIPYYGEPRPVLINLVLDFDPEIAGSYPNLTRLGDTLTAEIAVPSLHGKGGYVWAKAGPLYDDSGEIIGAIETTRDITELMAVQAALAESARELETNQQMLRDKNAALREIIRQIDAEKKRLVDQIQGNVDRLIKPIVRSMEQGADPGLRRALRLLQGQLDGITAPFVNKIERAYQSLSPREMQICSMIREGMTCKEVSETLHVSVNTVLNQRQRIRQKLKLSRKKVNLRSFLKSI